MGWARIDTFSRYFFAPPGHHLVFHKYGGDFQFRAPKRAPPRRRFCPPINDQFTGAIPLMSSP